MTIGSPYNRWRGDPSFQVDTDTTSTRHLLSTSLEEFHELFDGYQPPAACYDEAVDDGELRPPYQALVRELDRLGRFEFARRWTQAKRAVRDNGIAYSGDFSDAVRPRFWTLDALPGLIPAAQWQPVQAAVAQRAKLWNFVLQDLYGPQQLLKDGTLPAELVYSDPNFQRNCRHLTTGEQISDDFLHLYAADLARAPNGDWWVVADRTEAPSGLGYALEHRIIASQLLPSLFRDSRTCRLAPFFVTLQDRLRSLAPFNRDNPRVVLLSDGPANPYHMEDAYLSRYLGYLLVEDGDLAVRGSKLMLKTLGGLQPVDVVLRHQNASECDPLEQSRVEGVAGLTQVVRQDSVAIVNQLGSGLVESSAYMAFSRILCKAVLGEELLLPNVATWWCGEKKSLDFVLANLNRLIVQPAFRNRGNDQSNRVELLSLSKDQLAARIRANPSAFVGQEIVQRSSVPVWGRRLTSQRLAVRAYAISEADNDEFHVMDGGLGRVTRDVEPLEVSIRNGESGKDIWILSDTPVKHVTLLTQPELRTPLRRSGADLPSRVADNLYWLGRRLERTEDHARLIGITAKRMTGELRYDELQDMPMLLRCLGAEGLIEPGYAMQELRATLPNISLELSGFVFAKQPDSLASGIGNLVRLGYLVRDRLSVEGWRIIQQVESSFRIQERRRLNLADVVEAMNELQMLLSAFTGIVIEGMTRTQVFQFLDLGRRIERSHQILGILNEGTLREDESTRMELETTLELLQSLMTYRARYMAKVYEIGVLDLVVSDETNPRSLAYQFMRAKQHIDQLPRVDFDSHSVSPEQLSVAKLLNEVRTISAEEALSVRGQENPIQLWAKEVTALSNSLSHRYLVHAKSRQISDLGS